MPFASLPGEREGRTLHADVSTVDVEAVRESAARGEIDRVVLRGRRGDGRSRAARAFRGMGIEVVFLGASRTGEVEVEVLQRKPVGDGSAFAKRAFDVAFATAFLALAGPFLLLVGVAVKMDSSGPALFRQCRTGLNGASFVCLKFRSMAHEEADPRGERQTERNDSRVTRVGKWIRRASVDEMPQFLNVLRGDMSVVGPRPHAPGTTVGGVPFEDVDPDYPLRHRVKPGITGLAQVRGSRGEIRSPEELRQRVAWDLEYIRRRSLFMDVRIALATPLALLKDKAY